MRIAFESVSFAYPGNKEDTTLCDITFSLEEGEFLGIAGHTGSGKSTLIQHMNGLLQPTRGRVLVNGQDLANKRTLQTYRGKIGLVFQYPEHQLFAATVEEDVAFGPRNLGLSEEETALRVNEALKSVGLNSSDVGKRSPFELSGGQQRRVALAGILAMKPEVLALDEPAAGLDPKTHRETLDLIADLHAKGLSIVMVSHCMEDLAYLSDRVLVLDKGRIFAWSSPAQVFAKAEELRTVGLDVPQAQALALELQAQGINLSRALYNQTDLVRDLAILYKQAW